ncbi:MAG: RluA family pseudouridine synthase [Candidatus Omnitrophota bacterium]
MGTYTLKVFSSQSSQRLDLFILKCTQEKKLGFSRTFIQQLILEGQVKLEGQEIRKPHHKVKVGDVWFVAVREKRVEALSAEDIHLEVVYEDEDLAVINKPVGLVVHPAPGNLKHTLVNALLNRFKSLSDINPGRPGIVHRLDKETSGLLVIAKNNFTHLALTKQFASHTVKRRYIAVVKGKVEFDENVIEAPIGRHPLKRKNMAVSFLSPAKYAKTHYRTLKRTQGMSLLELKPFTGRTHQLRVHLAYIQHPILGDKKYGKNDTFARLGLHACLIGFQHPRTKKYVEWSCQTPKEFLELFKSSGTSKNKP